MFGERHGSLPVGAALIKQLMLRLSRRRRIARGQGGRGTMAAWMAPPKNPDNGGLACLRCRVHGASAGQALGTGVVISSRFPSRSVMTSLPEGRRKARTSPSDWTDSSRHLDFRQVGLDLKHQPVAGPRVRFALPARFRNVTPSATRTSSTSFRADSSTNNSMSILLPFPLMCRSADLFHAPVGDGEIMVRRAECCRPWPPVLQSLP